MFHRDQPYNDLPPLPPVTSVETPAVLKKTIRASRALAELKGMAERMPNQGMLIDSLALQEARLSSEIENILTTNDELYQAAADETLPASPEAKEVLRYREALKYGFSEIRKRPLATNLFIAIAQRIKQTTFSIRRTPGTRVVNGRGETVYTPPEGEAVIREKLAGLERFLHEEDGGDALLKMSLAHYQFEAIHPFPDGNGRTGRILNVLYLVEQRLLDVPVLYVSRHITQHKAQYYEGLRRVTEEGAWEDWVLYMLDAVEQTSLHTQQQIVDVLGLMETVRERVQREAPAVYSKDLVELVFRNPYCKIAFLERAGFGTRQTCAKYLRELERIGVLEGHKLGREVYFVNRELLTRLTR